MIYQKIKIKHSLIHKKKIAEADKAFVKRKINNFVESLPKFGNLNGRCHLQMIFMCQLFGIINLMSFKKL